MAISMLLSRLRMSFVGASQFFDLVLKLAVHRAEFFVERLQLFLRALKFLVGRLELLVHRHHFFVGTLQLFDRALQVLTRGFQLVFQLPDRP